MMVNRTDKQVFLRIDGRLNVQHQMDVFDELKAGGVRDVGIVTDAPTTDKSAMTETVTDIIVARSRQSEGLQTMVALVGGRAHRPAGMALLLSGTASSRTPQSR